MRLFFAVWRVWRPGVPRAAPVALVDRRRLQEEAPGLKPCEKNRFRNWMEGDPVENPPFADFFADEYTWVNGELVPLGEKRSLSYQCRMMLLRRKRGTQTNPFGPPLKGPGCVPTVSV